MRFFARGEEKNLVKDKKPSVKKAFWVDLVYEINACKKLMASMQSRALGNALVHEDDLAAACIVGGGQEHAVRITPTVASTRPGTMMGLIS